MLGGEVPATKLAALQKVLQSEFLNAVREVYEHVYETVDVQGNPEIRASATAKVMMNLKSSCWLIVLVYCVMTLNGNNLSFYIFIGNCGCLRS